MKRITSTSGTFSIYAADVVPPWEWVSFSEGQLAGDDDQEIRPLSADTDISVTVRNTRDQSELDVVFRLSGTQFTVTSVSAAE